MAKGAAAMRFNIVTGFMVLVGAVTAAWAQAPGERSAVIATDCDRSCLISSLHSYMDALAHKDPGRARFAKSVRFTENDVEMPIGDGLSRVQIHKELPGHTSEPLTPVSAYWKGSKRATADAHNRHVICVDMIQRCVIGFDVDIQHT